MNETKNKLELKDIFSIGLSFFALIVSLSSLYVSSIRTIESISLISESEPYPTIRSGMLEIKNDSFGEVTFVNNGNRAIIVSSLNIYYAQPTTANSDASCDPRSSVKFTTTFEPTTIRQYDVSVKKFFLQNSVAYFEGDILSTKDPSGAWRLPILEYNKGGKDLLIDICLEIVIRSPSEAFHSAILPVFRTHATEKGSYYNMDSGTLIREPAVLLHKTGMIFFN